MFKLYIILILYTNYRYECKYDLLYWHRFGKNWQSYKKTIFKSYE